jgi:elongation factor G
VKEYEGDKIRNLALVSHGGAGKTTLVESMLFTTGIVPRQGRVADGTTVSDSTPEEMRRKISLTLSLAHLEWGGTKVNLIDTPGYFDFFGEVTAALAVADAALLVVNAQSGAEAGTERIWDLISPRKLPTIACITMMDKEQADFDKAIETLRGDLSERFVAVQMPLGKGPEHRGIVDLVKMKAFIFEGGKAKETALPGDLEARAREMRDRLIESAAEGDDALVEKYLEGGELSPEEIIAGIRKGVAAGSFFPVLVASGEKGIGVPTLLDFVAACAPSPLDARRPLATKPGSDSPVDVAPDRSAPVCAFVFKTVSEHHVGEFSYLRVYSGALHPGDEVLNVSRDKSEKMGQIYMVNGKERREVSQLAAGDIGAAVKLKITHTNDTLAARERPIAVAPIVFPEPVLTVAIRPKSKGDEDKISTGIARIREEDPTVSFVNDSEGRQLLLNTMGELQADVVGEKLKSRFGVEVETAKPRVPYRETIKAKIEAQYRHKKQTGGRGQFADVSLRLEPLPRGTGFEFVDDVVGGVIPNKYIPAVEKGVVEAMQEGVLAGYLVVDVRVSVYYGGYHDVDSSDMAFKIAGLHAFRKGVLEARPILLEPIMRLEIQVPEDHMGDVMGDLSSRRGKILGMERSGRFQLVKALVPLPELYKYSTQLRSMTQGRAEHHMEFDHYEEVPKEQAEKIIEEAKAATAETK